jgi:RimJ/RimL family protein N-acetyltransferase
MHWDLHWAARSDFPRDNSTAKQTEDQWENPWVPTMDEKTARHSEPHWASRTDCQKAECLEQNWELEKVLTTVHHWAARLETSWDESWAHPKVGVWAHQLELQTEHRWVATTALRWGGY